MFLSNNPSSGDINLSNLSCFKKGQLCIMITVEVIRLIILSRSGTNKSMRREC